MHLHPLPSTANPANTAIFLEAFFQSCQQLSLDPLEAILKQPDQMQFETEVIERFILELGLAFFQRLQKIEQVSSEPFTMRQTMIQANRNGGYLILFQVLLCDGSLLPETGIAFSFLTSHDNLLEIRQCLEYPQAHRVTLKRAMLDTEGHQWQAGDLVSHDRVDAVLRWGLVQQLKE